MNCFCYRDWYHVSSYAIHVSLYVIHVIATLSLLCSRQWMKIALKQTKATQRKSTVIQNHLKYFHRHLFHIRERNFYLYKAVLVVCGSNLVIQRETKDLWNQTRKNEPRFIVNCAQRCWSMWEIPQTFAIIYREAILSSTSVWWKLKNRRRKLFESMPQLLFKEIQANTLFWIVLSNCSFYSTAE